MARLKESPSQTDQCITYETQRPDNALNFQSTATVAIVKAKGGIREEGRHAITESVAEAGDENMEEELDEHEVTGPPGLGLNNVILSFAQVLNNSNITKKLDQSGVNDQPNNNGQIDHSINQDPFEWP